MVEARKKISVSESTGELKDTIIHLIQDKKGRDIVCLDLRGIPEAVSDYFIICTGTSNTHVQTIVDHVLTEVKKRKGVNAIGKEGTQVGEWALIDYVDIVVHVFQKNARELYALEELWSDAKMTEFEDIV